MKNNLITKVVPGFVQRAILKNWLPFGDGYMDNMMGMGGPSWLNLDDDDAIKKGFMGNPTVYMIINFMTSLASQIPWVLYEIKDETKFNRWKALDPTDVIRRPALRTKAMEEVKENDILTIWKHPNEQQTRAEFIEQIMGYRELTGDGYVTGLGPISGPNTGVFKELHILPSQLIGIKYGGPMDPVKHYYWRGDPSKIIQKPQVMHTKHWNPLPISQGGLYGLSPIVASSKLLTRSNDGLTASVKMLQNMGAVGMLSREVSAAGDKGLTVEQAEMIEEKYAQKYGGAANRGKIMVTGAAVKWQQMGMSPVDMNIINQEKMDLRMMCSIYALQSQLFNDPENKTYNNMREARQAAYTLSVLPRLGHIRDDINRWWIEPFRKRDGKNYWLDLDQEAIPELQPNMKEMVEWLKDADMLTINEKRATMEREPLDKPGMDEIWIDGNKLTLDQAMADVEAVDKYMNYLKT